MHPPSWFSPVRVEPAWIGAVSPSLARLGARSFRVAAGPSFDPGDLWITLPGAQGGVEVIVPRGFGWPRLARRAGTGWRSEPAGEPCAAVRWESAGPVCAWLRRVEGAGTVAEPPRPGGAPSGWLVVRPRQVGWAVARREGARGVVVVGRALVQAASPAARARGFGPGMTVAAARRQGVTVVAPDPKAVRAAWARVGARLAELGEVRRTRSGFAVAWRGDAESPAREMDRLSAVARWLQAEEGVEVSAAVAAEAALASRVAGQLSPGWVAWVPGSASGAWSAPAGRQGLRVGPGWRSWRGPVPDVESALAIAGGLAAGLGRGPIELRLRHQGGVERVGVELPDRAGTALAGGLVAAALRRPLPSGIVGIDARRGRRRVARPAPEPPRWNLAPLFAVR